MYSYCTLKVLYFLLFGFKGIVSTKAINLEYDITKLLDRWIAEIFAIDVEIPAELFATINDYRVKECQLLKGSEDRKLRKFNDLSWEILNFQNISFHVEHKSRSEEGCECPQLHWKFSQDELRVFCEKIHIKASGTISQENGDKIINFITSPFGIENFTLKAKVNHSFKCPENLNTLYSISNSGLWHWTTDHVGIGYIEDPVDRAKNKLTRRIIPALPKLLYENIYNNPKFADSLDQIFQTFTHPRVELISMHQNFLSNPQQYYYLIPKFPFRCFELKQIVINGLTNLDSFKMHKTSPFFTHTLLIKNLQGSMVLDYKSINETSLEFKFKINSLFVMKNYKISCINVQAKYYSLSRAVLPTKSLSTCQQEVLMNVLESAIASSIVPFTKVRRICDLDTPLEKIQIPNKSDWKTIKESYKKWIPFNDD